jgi:hypothetical protein
MIDGRPGAIDPSIFANQPHREITVQSIVMAHEKGRSDQRCGLANRVVANLVLVIAAAIGRAGRP